MAVRAKHEPATRRGPVNPELRRAAFDNGPVAADGTPEQRARFASLQTRPHDVQDVRVVEQWRQVDATKFMLDAYYDIRTLPRAHLAEGGVLAALFVVASKDFVVVLTIREFLHGDLARFEADEGVDRELAEEAGGVEAVGEDDRVAEPGGDGENCGRSCLVCLDVFDLVVLGDGWIVLVGDLLCRDL